MMFGSMLSDGNWGIILLVAVLVIAAIIAAVIYNKKKSGSSISEPCIPNENDLHEGNKAQEVLHSTPAEPAPEKEQLP